jgi:hypothetical protein
MNWKKNHQQVDALLVIGFKKKLTYKPGFVPASRPLSFI